MKLRKKLQKRKKLKTKYYYIDNNNEIYGETDNCCRTMINLFTVFNAKSREVFFDVDNLKKTVFDKENSLQLRQTKKIKVYKYQNKVIKRKDFILLLGCEEK